MAKLFRFFRTSAAATLFLLAFVTFAFFYQGGGQNESARFDTIRAYIETSTVAIDSFAQNSTDVITVHGRRYSSKAPGTFFLGLIPFAVSNAALSLVGVEENIRYHWVCYFTNLFTNALLGALLVVMIFRHLLREGATPANAVAVSLAVAFGTSFMPFTTMFFSHVASALCLFFAYDQFSIMRGFTTRRSESWRPWSAGAALGFSVCLEYPSAIGVAILLAYYFSTSFKKEKMTLLMVAVGTLAGILPLLCYNLVAFNDPFYVTYDAYTQGTSTAFSGHKRGMLGFRFPLFDATAWPQFFSNLLEITVKPLRGLFFNNPLLIFILPGFAILFRRAPKRIESWVGFAIFACYLVMNASFGDSVTYWGGGASFGPRHLIVTLPFLALALHACVSHARLRPYVAPVALLSVFVCLMATAVEPRAPYLPPNSIFYFYFPRFIRGVHALSQIGVFSNVFLTSDSVAFNWGKLIGLPAQLQLAPLYAVWLLSVRRLDRQTRGALFYPVAVLVFFAAWLQIAGMW